MTQSEIANDIYVAWDENPELFQLTFSNQYYTNSRLATSQEGNVILLSGFSPSALTYLLTKELITPKAIVLDIINSPRYAAITVG